MTLATCPWRMTGSEPRTAEDCDIEHCIIDIPHAVMESHTHAICYRNENEIHKGCSTTPHDSLTAR